MVRQRIGEIAIGFDLRYSNMTVVELAPFSPLLEEKWYASGDALIPDRSRPIGMHRARVRAAFTAADHPIDAWGSVPDRERTVQSFDILASRITAAQWAITVTN